LEAQPLSWARAEKQTICMRLIHSCSFSALAQLNGWASKTAPWQYPAATGTVREALRQRLRFLPYLYSAFADYHFQGNPPLRAMLLEDPRMEKAEDQFMFGPSLLAAPFYDKTGWAREVVLPAGTWYDFYTGEALAGGRKIKTANDVGRMPLFVKEGAVIPMIKEALANTDQAYGRDLEVLFYGKTGGTFDLYEDDGRTFDYDKGQYRIRRLTVKKDAKGAFELSETAAKDGGPALFGKAALRVMSR
jgi:alpha-glucosidase (family GH31 glycosyl hydrolase)